MKQPAKHCQPKLKRDSLRHTAHGERCLLTPSPVYLPGPDTVTSLKLFPKLFELRFQELHFGAQRLDLLFQSFNVF